MVAALLSSERRDALPPLVKHTTRVFCPITQLLCWSGIRLSCKVVLLVPSWSCFQWPSVPFVRMLRPLRYRTQLPQPLLHSSSQRRLHAMCWMPTQVNAYVTQPPPFSQASITNPSRTARLTDNVAARSDEDSQEVPRTRPSNSHSAVSPYNEPRANCAYHPRQRSSKSRFQARLSS